MGTKRDGKLSYSHRSKAIKKTLVEIYFIEKFMILVESFLVLIVSQLCHFPPVNSW